MYEMVMNIHNFFLYFAWEGIYSNNCSNISSSSKNSRNAVTFNANMHAKERKCMHVYDIQEQGLHNMHYDVINILCCDSSNLNLELCISCCRYPALLNKLLFYFVVYNIPNCNKIYFVLAFKREEEEIILLPTCCLSLWFSSKNFLKNTISLIKKFWGKRIDQVTEASFERNFFLRVLSIIMFIKLKKLRKYVEEASET